MLLFAMLLIGFNSNAQTGPWAKYNAQFKGEALVRDADGGYLESIKSIVEGGGDVNWQLQPSGLTPLMAAATGGYIEVVRYLLSVGADPNIKDANGKTALDRAKSAGANDVVKLLSQTAQKKPVPQPVNTTVVTKEETKKPVVVNTVNTKVAGNTQWPPLGSISVKDSVMFWAGSWKRGVIKEVGIKVDNNTKTNAATQNKYLVAPDAYANWPDWTDWSMVVKPKREPFWTSWFIGDWKLGEVMAVNTRESGGYERNEYSYMSATEALQINANGTYKWKPYRSKEISGKWVAAADGPGIVLQKGYQGLDWTIRNESTGTEIIIRKLDKARLYPPTNSVMSISAKRPMSK